MAYTDLELLRKEIADDYKYAFDVQTGDGQTTVFKLSHDKIKDESYQVFVANNLQEETTDYTIDLERVLQQKMMKLRSNMIILSFLIQN